ncbi:MAG: GcvT family protein [Solirubrobacterales bacterium]|nr:GcvT family protein [Solirubrobacterales bacterium]
MASEREAASGRVRVAVIGGGIAGCSVLYHLALRGCTDAVLLEQSELTAGSTWHAAGLCTQFAANPSTMRLLKRSLDLYDQLEERTGQPAGLHRCGSVRLAESPARLDQFHHVSGIAAQVGVPMRVITPEEAAELFPLMSADGVLAAAHLPTDGHADPSGVTAALAAGATAMGVRIRRQTKVTALVRERGGWSIETTRGPVRADVVVNAAGQWAREVGRLASLDLPVVPLQHHYVVTEPLPAVRALGRELPVLRDPEASFYARQEGEALLVGPFESHPTPWAVDGIPEGFHGKLLPARLEAIEDVLVAAARRIPCFESAGLKTIVNGPDGYTPDGRALIGPVPGARDFHVIAGFSIFGIVFGGGAGALAADWILDGEPGEDPSELDVRRFGAYAAARHFLIPKALDAYTREYAIEFPDEERPVARPMKTSPLYDKLAGRGAVYGARSGWERPVWFRRRGALEEYSYRRPNWHEAVRAECEAVRGGVGVLDQTSFAKFEVGGPGAEAYLDRLCANALPSRPGRVALTQMCTEAGGIECDVTVTRLDDERFYVVSAAAAEAHDEAWLHAHLPGDGSVQLENVTSRYGVLTLAGPHSRELLSTITDADCSARGFPFFSGREIEVGMAPVRALRMSFAGELGYELHHPIEYQRHIYEQLLGAGRALGLVDFGYRALESMRLEKAYRMWGLDLSPDFTPLEAGMDRWVCWEKPFIGRRRLLAVAENGGPQRNLACLVVDAEGADAHRFEPVRDRDRMLGCVTSGGYGFRVQRSIALCYLPRAYCEPGTRVTVEILGRRRAAEVVAAPLYDPSNKLLTS